MRKQLMGTIRQTEGKEGREKCELFNVRLVLDLPTKKCMGISRTEVVWAPHLTLHKAGLWKLGKVLKIITTLM
jgi:hypothetical protein